MKRQRKRRGVLTVEAALILPLFIMVMCFVLNMLNLFYFHAVMQQALSNVGRTVSQYAYVIDKTIGLDNLALDEETKAKEGKLAQDINNVIGGAKDLVGLLNGKITLDTLGKIINEGENFKDDLESLTGSLQSVNKEDIVNYLIVSAMNGADDVFMKWMIGDYLRETKALVGSIDEIEYAVYVEEGTKDIIFVVQYDYDLPFEFFDEVHLQQTLRVHPWVGGETPGAFGKEAQTTDNQEEATGGEATES